MTTPMLQCSSKEMLYVLNKFLSAWLSGVTCVGGAKRCSKSSYYRVVVSEVTEKMLTRDGGTRGLYGLME